mgnify:CR=1 FL=1
MRLRSDFCPRATVRMAQCLNSLAKTVPTSITGFDQTLDLTHNGRQLEFNDEIADGDEVRLDNSHLLLTFYPIRSLLAVVGTSAHEAHVAPFIEQAAIESAATARRDDAKVFLREFTRELVKEINPSTKLIIAGFCDTCWWAARFTSGFSVVKEMQRAAALTNDDLHGAARRDEG